ncbi:DNA helicase, partial [Escherichia coli]
PRSGDFVRQSPGVQGAAAIGRPLRAPCASDYMKQCT